jgi:hypothetical protein
MKNVKATSGALSGAILLAGIAAISQGWSQNRTRPLFQTSDRCLACHNGMRTQSGEEVSIGLDWRSSMMANSSRDPYWQASVRREAMDHPESGKAIEDECAVCHMPMARYESKLAGREAEVFSHLAPGADRAADRLAVDGVSCSLCHQITPDKLGSSQSFVGRFVVETAKPIGEKAIYGPYQIDNGHTRIMRSSSGGFKPAEGKHIQQSELCATCHTLYTKALGPGGKVIGELPEQVPYQEWLHSAFKETKSCQSCHMPVVKEEVPITRVLGKPRPDVSRHVFVGGNFFIQRMLNQFRGDLGVWALPQELLAAANRTAEHLKSETAQISIDSLVLRSGRLEVAVSVRNLGGHKLPTAYPSRRSWLHVVVRDSNDRLIFESGALDGKGAIAGNDNDTDPARYEPHYSRITASDQVQIYEAIMVDASGRPTTGLLQAVRYEKDNRLLPRGFEKRTADKDIAVRGEAAGDADFIGGSDTVHYSVAVDGSKGPFRVQAELCFQPVSFRWASNLRAYDAPEPRRFVTYYDAMAAGSALTLASTSAHLQSPE